jgi:hypothetical protein
MSSSISLSELEKIVEQVISEQKWGKKQGRDYSNEKKTAGDPENIARKQARRDAEKKGLVKPGDGKHVHHPNGVDPSAKNGGDYEIVDAADNLGGKESPGDQRARGKPTVKKSVLIKIIEDEVDAELEEGIGSAILGKVAGTIGSKAASWLAGKAFDKVTGAYEEDSDEIDPENIEFDDKAENVEDFLDKLDEPTKKIDKKKLAKIFMNKAAEKLGLGERK